MKKLLTILILLILFATISWTAEPIKGSPVMKVLGEGGKAASYNKSKTEWVNEPIKHLPTVKELAKQAEKKPVQLAWGVMGVMGGTSAAAACSTGSRDNSGTVIGYISVVNGDTKNYGGQGQNYAAQDTQCICKVTFNLTQVGDISGKTFTANIWGPISGTYDAIPTTPISTSAAVTGAAWSSTAVDFSFSSCASMTAGSKYYVTVNMDGNSDGTNYIRLNMMNNGVYSGLDTWWNKSKAFTNGGVVDVWLKLYW